jgi:hypothetical protein
MAEEIKFINLENIDFSTHKSWQIEEMLKDFLMLFSEKHSNLNLLGHASLPRLPEKISQTLGSRAGSLKTIILEEIKKELRNNNLTFNNIVSYFQKQNLKGIDDLLGTYFFRSETDPKITKNIKTLFKFLGLRGNSGLFYFKSNYFRFFEDLSASGEERTREIVQKHFLKGKKEEMEELHQALIEIFEKIEDLRSKENFEKKTQYLEDEKAKFTKEKAKAEAEAKVAAKETEKSSDKLAKFFEEEVERIAGKNGLPRSCASRNDEEKEEKPSEIEKLEEKVFWLRILVYAIPALTIALILFSRHCETCFSEAWQSSYSDWHFWAALSLFFIISSYHLTQSIRELNVLKNMAASYRHRQIVAKTFASFVDNIAKTHPEMKDIVTKEAALAMFKRDSSGYLSKNQMEPSNTPVQEVVGVLNRGK